MPEIYLHLDGQQKGPYQPAQVRQLLAEGKISAETSAWYQGLSEWSTVAKVLEAFSVTEGVPPPFVPPPPPPVPQAQAAQPPAKKGMSGCMLAVLIVGGIGLVSLPFIACLAGIALGPIEKGIERAKETMAMQRARQIGIAMFAYADDHNGAYHDGKTSTEVFQKLLDGNYVSDPATFYIAMPGKTKPTSNQLTAANVCYDVTSGVTSNSPDNVPVVFTTGYTVIYSAGITMRDPGASAPFRGIDVAYKGNGARFIQAGADGSIRNFIPLNFDPDGKTYQQLRP